VTSPDRHSRLVRATHWINFLSFVLLVVSGFAILMAHPRFYWGESGNLEMEPMLQLPLTLDTGHSAWGRNLHFLGAWISVITGAIYVVTGVTNKHFYGRMWPARLPRTDRPETREYNVVQKLAYLAVIFGLFPIVIQTGLAMSPAVVTAWPWMVTVWGGHQSARFIHFVVSDLILLFVIGHVIMVSRAGFKSGMRAMVLGQEARVT
jgi:thiosulfate reductase cytochrome b subunit